ncbi:hypothetical protein DWB85_09350 [Seongchinamella sediminis]|uniref:Lipopolysaccharide kinase (Kdo/WaaP) family protein n=1 Tax=Seongchinamella sediminis TaxID=2283635 RepID=A0A3L7DZZ6_9GAMM|nr:lipopolysaccharide kinase InaA family protein [Seongchinamella sediminis]RLQ22130.1 hypothetical protein DWB85_09350 [Seongchinamella sediminis]
MTRPLRGGDWAAGLQRELPPQSPEQWLASHCQVVKRDSHSLVALGELQQRYCYLKFYRPKSPLQRLAFRLGRGRAVQAFDSATLLAASDIAVPAPLACVRVPGGLLLVTAGMALARDLKSCWQDRESMAPLLAGAAQALAALHRGGFAHGDCKWSNLLWCDDRVYLVDLEAVELCRPGSAAQWRDLARFTVNAEDLALPAPDYQDFLARYCQLMGLDQGTALSGIAQPLERLRRRHRGKYGPRGERLV